MERKAKEEKRQDLLLTVGEEVHVLEVLEGDVVGVPPVDRDQVALDVGVVGGEFGHRLERRPLDDRQARVAVDDAVRGRGRGPQPGLRFRGVGVLPEVKHDHLGVGVGLFVF